MQRIAEPELMEGFEQAKAYAEADFREPNALFIELFAATFPDFSGAAKVIDLGCGPGHILMDFGRRYPDCTCLGIDGSEAMLRHGRTAAAAISQSRVTLSCATLPLAEADHGWQVILSNSLLHHLRDPGHLWQSIMAIGSPGALVLVMDLFRPASQAEAKAIVSRYSGNEPQILQDDFYNSLCAAYRPEEITAQLTMYDLALHCQLVSDRHLAVWGQLPG